jgi:hypothetical protein
MNKQNYMSFIALFMICSVLLSCESTMTPLQVSEKFWRGIQKKNITLVTIYSLSEPKIKTHDLEQLPDISDVTFGRIIIDGDHSEIETNLTILSDKKTTNISVKTVLINENNKWKVRYDQTMLPLMANQQMTEILGDIQEITEGLAEEIKESVEDIKEKAMPEIKSKLKQAEEVLREKLPEFKNMIDEFLQDLGKSIEDALPAKEEAKTQET